MAHFGTSLFLVATAALVVTTQTPGAEPPTSDHRIASISAPLPVRTAYLAGGCFWGVETVFEHVVGVTEAVSGYAGGATGPVRYDEVSAGTTGHAETVRVTFDPAVLSYEQILQIFFSVVHDPTQLNRQGPDVGPQYRSAIFTTGADQARVAREYIAQLVQARSFNRPIVTQIHSLTQFFVAEEYHQDFAARNPRHPYIVYHDAPKVANLKRDFPTLFRTRPATVSSP